VYTFSWTISVCFEDAVQFKIFWMAAPSGTHVSCTITNTWIYGTRWPSGTRLDFAIARSRVRLPPVAAVYQRLLSVPSLRGRLMSSSIRATGWRPSAADWGSGMSVVLCRGSTCPLSRAVDGCIPRHGIISLCQSAATSRIVKRCCLC